MEGKTLPFGKTEGHYFAISHHIKHSQAADGIAKALYERGLVKIPTPELYENDEQAEDVLGMPIVIARMVWAST